MLKLGFSSQSSAGVDDGEVDRFEVEVGEEEASELMVDGEEDAWVALSVALSEALSLSELSSASSGLSELVVFFSPFFGLPEAKGRRKGRD